MMHGPLPEGLERCPGSCGRFTRDQAAMAKSKHPGTVGRLENGMCRRCDSAEVNEAAALAGVTPQTLRRQRSAAIRQKAKAAAERALLEEQYAALKAKRRHQGPVRRVGLGKPMVVRI